MMKRGFGLLELLLALVAIMFLYFLALKPYFKKLAPDTTSKEMLSSQGIDTSSYKTVLESTKNKLQEIDKQTMEREKSVEDIK